ncbi:CLUMA_CG000838, isoform A [Clunio marinus]|uniref:CLUMA_CG000838, isoform A n=1 Tax=Clunio marinus TaxID=568069 RepID=A0A1J1HGE6_9DIPT|nr:CLUMA_CG000838, isoform A [Clunio marinus]
MMGLQATIKTTKRKYEIEADCEAEKKEASPPKAIKYSVSKAVTNNKVTSTKDSLKSDTDIIPPETHQWPNEPIVDSISKLQAVTETWNSNSLSSTPFNSTSNTLSSLAQTAENITRSTLATTLLDQGDLMDSDEDDFQEDFDFESDDDELLDDQTMLTNQNYAPIRYPSPSPSRQNYIPASPKPGYTPEPYQNCSRTPTAATQFNNGPPHHQSPLRPSFFNGTNNGNGSWNYYNHQHYDLAPTQQPQTIRCAENGKSYFELGSSNYCGPNRMCNGGLGMMKNCCEGRNNLWCTAKQCYKEKRLKMMNLSMFKLARFRQASDQSLYRSVLICNTLKSLEKEIELENQIYHQRLQHHHRQALHQNQASIEYSQTFARPGADSKQQQNNNLSNENSMINCNSNLNACNNSFSQPYNTNNCIINRISSFNEPIPYEHHPLKDPSSGRATPFPSPGISSLAAQNNVNDTDSAFGDVDDVDSVSTRSIDWGSVLSLSSQSALDPLSNNDIFTNPTSSSTTSSTTQNSTTITNLNITISNGCGNVSSNSNTPSSSSVSTPISSIITTLTTVSSCSLESLTASSISVSPNVSNSNWDFPYLETESSNNSEFYELNCYKLASALNSMDDFVKSDPLVTPVSSVSPSNTNELEQVFSKMTNKQMLLCYNKGCQKEFDVNDNGEDKCCFHPGHPIFHDAYKAWSCCNKKSIDFTEFLNYKGCTIGKHSNVKPLEPEKKKEKDVPIIVEKKEVKVAKERPPFDSPCTKLEPTISPSFKKQMDNLDLTKNTQISSDGSIPIGTMCKHGGCKSSYESKYSDDEICLFHPGVAIFHEGYKYWSCCQKKTSDFTSFLNQEGCETGKHKWIQDEESKKVNCRWDWHQTGSTVVVAVYAKNYDYRKSFVNVNPIRLTVKLIFPQQDDAEFNIDLELRGIIDVPKTTASMFGTKIEISMTKAEGGQWLKLDYPRENPGEKEKQDPPAVTASILEPEKKPPLCEEENVSDIDLDDIELVEGAKITELGELARTCHFLLLQLPDIFTIKNNAQKDFEFYKKMNFAKMMVRSPILRFFSSEIPRVEKTVNTVTLLGRVGAEPQKRGSEEHPVMTFSLATHNNYKYESGDWVQRTDWHRIVVFKPTLRDSVQQYLKKGQRTLVTGKISYGEITDQEGKTRLSTSIIADEIIFFQNHEEDQNNELEALESIYYNELEVIEREPRIKFKIGISTEEFVETQDGLSCELLFTFTLKYPDEAPLLDIENDNFDDEVLREKLMDNMKSVIEENIGMEMIFTLVAGAQELLNTLFDEMKTSREEAKQRKEQELEEAERKRFEGTRVTVETFMNWRNEFEKEMGIAEKKAKEVEVNRKLTGRELFMRDQSLIDSDIIFLQQAGDSIDNVKIDESLFQALDLDGEDLPSDDDSDDPDFKP